MTADSPEWYRDGLRFECTRCGACCTGAPGYVWVTGYYQWGNGSYQWTPGHWERERANMMWEAGRWELRGDRYVWVEGRWAPGGNSGPRDHRHP